MTPPGIAFRIAVRLATIIGAAAIICGAVIIAGLWVWWQAEPSDAQRSRGINALWAGHTWVGDPHTDAEYRTFAESMRRNEISDVFFHAGPFDADGSVPPELIAHAEELLAAMQRHAPEIRTQAYLGQIEDRGGGILDLDDAAVRDQMLETAEMFLSMGFDGIHYDIEPIFPGDRNFLDLLARTRAVAAQRGAIVSVALEQMEFVPGAQRAASWSGYHDPPADFLRQVAEHVDQLAVMTYDSAMPVDWLYGAHMARQTARVVKAVGPNVTVFMGVPTYDEGTFMRFHSRAEHIRSGIRGVRKALDQMSGDETANVGIAVFAEWTTTEDEWAWWRRDWLGE